uniref:Uncharacterized protein n=1 Tax=Rhizophora mucronata TaxID=61149 RepID=A0A2P2QFN9_RHIMU
MHQSEHMTKQNMQLPIQLLRRSLLDPT